jgi:signal transduction histidine kinase
MVALESSKIFDHLKPEEMDVIRQSMVTRNYTTGEAVFREGDAGDGIYVIQAGQVEISVLVGSEGERKVFAHEGVGALFGEIAMVDDQPRSASAITTQESEICFIPRNRLIEIMERSPRFTRALMKGITHRLREFNRQYVDEVLQAERLTLVGRFTRSIVHDLKNPLNIIGIAADLGTMENGTPETRESARSRIRKQINRISNLVNEVVEFTRNSNTTFVLALMDYRKLVEQIIEELRSEMTLRSVTVKFVNDAPEVRLAVNPDRLARVFHNLFFNASEAMPEGGVISVKFEAKGSKVFTTISDDGEGIPPELIDSLFTAFVTHGKMHGTGLGLSICKRIIEDHRGHIWAENGTNSGASFTFTLPLPSSSQPEKEKVKATN